MRPYIYTGKSDRQRNDAEQWKFALALFTEHTKIRADQPQDVSERSMCYVHSTMH